MKELFAQGKGSTSILVNMQSIARDFGVTEKQVAYFEEGIDLSPFRVLYDQLTQRAYFLPSGLVTGTTAVSLATSGLLTHSNGTVDLGEYAAKRGEYFHTGFSFGMNYTLETHNQTILFGAGRYRWTGALPKQMSATDNPINADGLTGDGWFTLQHSVLNMTNVNATHGDRIAVSQGWLRCRYSEVSISSSNITSVPYANFIGSNGVPVGSAGRVYFPGEADHGQNGTRFPTGRQFNYGDTVFVMELQRSMMISNTSLSGRDNMRDKTKFVAADVYVNSPYVVTSPGVFIPDTEEADIKAAAVGDKTITQNLTPDGTSKGSAWLYVCQFSPGTRITIPGAGASGADLETYITKSPYQTPATNISAPITMGTAHPIQTAVPAGTRIRATEPLTTRPELTKARSAYWSISQL